MLPLEDLVRCQVAKDLKGSLPYIQGGGLQQSFLFHQVFEKGPFRMPRATLHLTMEEHHLKKQRRFQIGVEWQNDDVGGSLERGDSLNWRMRNPFFVMIQP